MRTWLLHHIDPPMAGHADRELEAAGVSVAHCHVSAGEALPRLEETAGLVVFGGHESARDLDAHPYLAEEVELLGQAVSAGIPVLGLCLGAQLLARSQDAAVSRMPRRQIGWAQPGLLPAAAEDLLFADAPPIPAPHWNEDAFELPAGAVELQERSGPGVEAFRLGACAWGTQYHPELDAEMLDSWYGTYADMLSEAGTTEAQARRDDARHLPGQAIAARHLFGRFAAVVREESQKRAVVGA